MTYLPLRQDEGGWGSRRATRDIGDGKCSLVKGWVWDHWMSGAQIQTTLMVYLMVIQ